MAINSYYEASVQVPHTEGFWMPHTEWDLQTSGRCLCITDAMQWLANNRASYDDKADVYISLVINGYTVVMWQFQDGHVNRSAMKAEDIPF